MTPEDRKVGIEDVRKALWNAYNKKKATPEGIEGKSSEAWVEVCYPTFWDCETLEEFQEPCGLNIYSYALGPSRMHYIRKAQKDGKPNYYTWESHDIFSKAVEVINSWVEAEIT